MLTSRIKRRGVENARAGARLVAIAASISALPDEDLLDLADIFRDVGGSPLGAMATAEMAKRGLSL